MGWKNHRQIPVHFEQRLQDPLQRRTIVDVGRTVQRDQGIALGQIISARLLRQRQQAHQRIDHDVADAEDLLRRNSLSPKILVPVLGRREQQVGKLIGHQAVDLLGHGSIERAQSSFDVADLNAQLGANQYGRDRRVHIPIHQDHVRLAFEHDGFHPNHDLRRLLGMGARTNRKVHIGSRDAELLEEHIGHIDVVVLASVDEGLHHILPRLQGIQDGSDLHEVGTSSDDVK